MGTLQAEQPSALAQITSAEIDVQVATARRFPRDLVAIEKKIVTIACRDQATAAAMTYKLPPRRNAQGEMVSIEGKSVRFAELLAQIYGNIRVSVRSHEPGPGDRTVSAQGAAMDLETNSAFIVEKHRRITNKDGDRYNDDMIVMTLGAASAVAYRDVVFKVIDPGVLDNAYRKIQQAALGDPAMLEEARVKAIAYFVGLGLTETETCKLVEKDKPENLTLEDLRSLAGFKTAIVEGTLKLDALKAVAQGTELDMDAFIDKTVGVTSENDSVHPSTKPKEGAKQPETAAAAVQAEAPTQAPPKGGKGGPKGDTVKPAQATL